MSLMFDRRFFTQFDWGMLILLILIPAVSLITLHSAAYDPASEPIQFLGFKIYSFIFIKQFIFFMMGYGVIFLTLFISSRSIDRSAYIIYAFCILLLLLVWIFGVKSNGSKRWLAFGSFRFQPSELMKIGVIICLSRYCSRKKDILKPYKFKDLGVPALLIFIPFLLILKQPDLGTALSIAFIGGGIVLFSGIETRTLVYLGFSFLASFAPAWMWLLKPYQKRRILALLNPSADPFNSGYHIIQSKIAVGSGQIFGKGYMQGTQSQLEFLPEHTTDFIFSVLSEEWGFFGAGTLILLYYLLINRTLKIAGKSRDNFSMFFAVGVALMLFFHVLVNTGMVLGILPVVGLPLPLLSYGGTAVLTNFLIFGLVLGISMRKFIFKGVDKLVLIFTLSCVLQFLSSSVAIAEETKTPKSKEEFDESQRSKSYFFEYDFNEDIFDTLPNTLAFKKPWLYANQRTETTHDNVNQPWREWYRNKLDIHIGIDTAEFKFHITPKEYYQRKKGDKPFEMVSEIDFDLSYYEVSPQGVVQPPIEKGKKSKGHRNDFKFGTPEKFYKVIPSLSAQQYYFFPYANKYGMVVIVPESDRKDLTAISGLLLCPRRKSKSVKVATLPILEEVPSKLIETRGRANATIRAKVNTGFGKGVASSEITTTRSVSPTKNNYDYSENIKPDVVVDYVPLKSQIPFYKVKEEKDFVGIKAKVTLHNSLNHFSKTETIVGYGIKAVQLDVNLPIKIDRESFLIKKGKCYSVARLVSTTHTFEKIHMKDSGHKSLEAMIDDL